MGRIKLGSTPQSQSYISHNLAKKRRKTSKKDIKNIKKVAKNLYQRARRRRLGRGGRAVDAAVDQARKKMMKEMEQARRSDWSVVSAGDLVCFSHNGKERTEKVFCVRGCNDPRLKTRAWIIIERSRKERERDRRLSRFLAVAMEEVKMKK